MALVKYNNNSISAVTSAASIPSGAMTLIKTLTASSSSTLSFVHGSNGVVLDNTYPIYKFEFINIHPATDSVNFTFNLSTDSGSNYNVTKTSSVLFTAHNEGDSATYLDYDTNQNFIITLASGSNTLAAVTTEASQIGQTGVIIFIQPSSSSAGTISLHGDYETAGAAGLTLSSANNAYDIVPYFVKADNSILLGSPQLAFS